MLGSILYIIVCLLWAFLKCIVCFTLDQSMYKKVLIFSQNFLLCPLFMLRDIIRVLQLFYGK